MDISSVNSDLIRGNVTTIILNSLADSDRYGYDILKEIEKKSEGLYKLKQPTLYSCLKRLEKNGLISSYPGNPNKTGGGKRKYYTLTDDGREFLNKEKEEYEYSRTILDKLVSEEEFDSSQPAPFNAEELRPYSKGKEEKKIVYKEKVVYKYVDDSRNIALGIIPESLKMSDKEIEFLEESSFNNHSKIYQDGHCETSEEENLISPIELSQESFDVDLKIKNKDTLNISDEELPKQKTEDIEKNQNAFNSIINGENIARKLNIENEENDVFLSQLKLNNEEAEEKETTKIEEEKEALPNSAANYDFDAKKAFCGQTFYEKFDNMVKERDRLSKKKEKENANDIDFNQNEPISYEEVPKVVESSKPSRQMLFNLIDEAEQKHDEYIKQRKNLDDEFLKKAEENGEQYVPGYVAPKLKGDFQFEQVDNSYVDFYEGLTSSKLQAPPENNQEPIYQDAILQNKLYSKGFTLKPYQKANTEEYYLNNFIYQTKLRRDSYLCVLLTYLLMLAILWGTCFERVNMYVFVGALCIGLCLYLIPLISFFVKPKKKVKAKFNFKTSMLNMLMLYIELIIIVLLIGFFIVKVDATNINTVIAPIIIPIALLLSLLFIPIYYGLLFKSKKYHIS